MTATRPLTAHGHQSKTAFCLMWYACPCGHQERIWNSREGGTPFGTQCPSCGNHTLRHERWGDDLYQPDHKPAPSQRVWITLIKQRAVQLATRLITSAIENKRLPTQEGSIRHAGLVDDIFHDGESPGLVVTGYTQEAK